MKPIRNISYLKQDCYLCVCTDGRFGNSILKIMFWFTLLLLLSPAFRTVFALDVFSIKEAHKKVTGNRREGVLRPEAIEIPDLLDIINQLKITVENQNVKIDEMRKFALSEETAKSNNEKIKSIENVVFAQKEERYELQNAKIKEMEQKIQAQNEEISELKNQIHDIKESSRKPELEINTAIQNTNKYEEKQTHNIHQTYADFQNEQGLNQIHDVRIRQTAHQNVAFTAYLDHEMKDLNPGSIIKCNRIMTNHGNGYNQFTGIFTVPVKGTYFVTFTIHNFNQKLNVALLKDGQYVIGAVVHTEPDPGTPGYRNTMSSNSAVIDAEVGNSIWIETAYDHNGDIYSTEGFRLVTFTAFLLF